MLAAAVANNAAWCDLVCRSHGLPTRRRGQVWQVLERAPRFYPDAMTLAPGVTAGELCDGIDAASVKDSFADVDLAADGFVELLSASWLGRAPATEAPRSEWTVSEVGDGPRCPDVRYLAGAGATAIVNRSGDVVGLSNVVTEHDAAWAELPAAVGRAFPGLPIVGYEHGAALDAALAAGFRQLGPLRVWLRPGLD